MERKYIFMTGGVVSSLGKGISAASIGALLRARGYTVTAIKIDPYINVDAGTMRPYEHGEVFVTHDGAETDLDIGTYERFLDIDLTKENNVTTGQVYLRVIERERAREYLAQTVQVIPHVTDEIKRRIIRAGELANADIVLIEVGGTVGDIESLPFLEAIRQLDFDVGHENTLYFHVTLVPYLGTSEEYKTKPTQHSVATLRSVGIQPDALILRSTQVVPAGGRKKIALFANVPVDAVFNSYDAPHVYAVPSILEGQGIGAFIERSFNLPSRTPDLSKWDAAVRILTEPERTVNIAVVGKYIEMPDAYLSLTEALQHAGIANQTGVNIRWIDAELLNEQTVSDLGFYHGILVPGGFGARGIPGKLIATEFAREQQVPFMGIGLGFQVAAIEFARNVAGLSGANSTEFSSDPEHPVVHLMPDQAYITMMGDTMRLGSWPMDITPGTKLAAAYGSERTTERHRHRYELNREYVSTLEQHGLQIAGITPGKDGYGSGLVEAIELPEHPFFVALQSHPELRSRLLHPHPVVTAFIHAALIHQEQRG